MPYGSRRYAAFLVLFAILPLARCAPTESAHAAAAQAPGAAPPAEFTPAPIGPQEFAARRAMLAQRLDDGVFVAIGAPEPDADYLPYAQDSSFRYLTGIVEPDAALVMVKSGGRVSTVVFVRPRDPAREIWEGHRMGVEGARAFTGAEARTIEGLHATVDSLLAEHGTLFTLEAVPDEVPAGGHLSPQQQRVARMIAARPGLRVEPVAEHVRQLRAAKSPAELNLIRAAVQITNEAHRQAQRAVQPGLNEFELHALIEYTFRRNGAERTAFASIVGSGPNSTTLHYRENDRFMTADDVVLMDIGASYQGYAADVTRTVPVGGRFRPDQRAIYEIVLGAQKAAESLVRPGATWDQLNAAANRVIADGLARLGLIDSPDATYLCESPRWGRTCPQFRLYYMHGLGHGVGLDVHDPDVSYYGPIREGSAFTIEPGIYVRADALDHIPDTPENRAMADRLRPAVRRYRDIGVRIEDVYIVTADGAERVSAGAPREIDEIEALLEGPRISGRDRVTRMVEWYRRMAPATP